MSRAIISMPPNDFRHWIGEMKRLGLAETEADLARSLGVNPNTIVQWKKRGADQRTALACAALLSGDEPYKETV